NPHRPPSSTLFPYTTLFRSRVVEAPEDTVFIDGISVRDYPLAQLRSHIGYVPQETFLFSDTLAENIAFGVSKAERAEIEWAAEIDRKSTRLNSSHEWISYAV